jgi:hypothetical protein
MVTNYGHTTLCVEKLCDADAVFIVLHCSIFNTTLVSDTGHRNVCLHVAGSVPHIHYVRYTSPVIC